MQILVLGLAFQGTQTEAGALRAEPPTLKENAIREGEKPTAEVSTLAKLCQSPGER